MLNIVSIALLALLCKFYYQLFCVCFMDQSARYRKKRVIFSIRLWGKLL